MAPEFSFTPAGGGGGSFDTAVTLAQYSDTQVGNEGFTTFASTFGDMPNSTSGSTSTPLGYLQVHL